MTTLVWGDREIELYDLSPQEALWLVAPDAAWLSMLPRTPLRDRPRTRCYRLPSGTPVHVLPSCRCR